jgi:adenosylcobinamide-phosphate synthase
MAFFSVLAAVALEQLRPLSQPLKYYRIYGSLTQSLEQKFNAGEFNHGAIAWGLAVLPLLLAVWVLYALVDGVSPLLGWALNVAVLYFTLGFKYYSADAEAIARLLRAGDLEAARAQLAARRNGDVASLSAEEVTRLAIEQVIAASHRQMFGVLFWFVLLSPLGPVGAVLYRCASILARRWADSRGMFGAFAQRAFHAINWLPARLTALTYAIAGNFEDATFCWRTQAPAWPEAEEGIVIAAGAGAMGVKLGQSLNVAGEWVDRPELGVGQDAEPDHIDSAVSMIWRGLVIWLFVGLLLVVASWVA